MDIIAVGLLIALAAVRPQASVLLWVFALVWTVVAVGRGINEHRARTVDVAARSWAANCSNRGSGSSGTGEFKAMP